MHDKAFSIYLEEDAILEGVKKVAEQIHRDHAGQRVLFLAVLNGSFMFAADLLKNYEGDCEISFVKVASYHGMSSSGTVSELIGLTENLEGRHVVILEDIVDTGLTLKKVYLSVMQRNPSSLKVATLLFKPDAYKGDLPIDYAGISIPNEFIVGYGLDYDGLGRNLRNIYKII